MSRKNKSQVPAKGFRMLLAKYVAFALLPVLVCLPLLDVLLHQHFKASYLERLQDALDSAQSQIQYSLKMVDTICVSIDKSGSIVSSMLDINAYSRVNVCKQLYSYSILNTLYSDLCLFSTQTPELLYTPIGTDLLVHLNEYNCFQADQSPDEQLQSLRQRRLYSNLVASNETPRTASQLRHSHSWLYICPGSLFSASAVTVLLRINTWTLYALYSDVLQQYDSASRALITLDVNGNIIGLDGTLFGGDTLLSPAWLSAQMNSHATTSIQTSHETFTHILFLDNAVIEDAIAPKLHIAHLIYFAALLLIFFVCFIMAKQTYRPITLLRENILTGISEMPIDSAEFRSIDQSIADIILTYNKREEQSKHILEMMKHQLIYWALLNNLPRTEHTDQLLRLTGFNQPNMLFCVLAIQLPASPEPTLVDNLCADIQQLDWNHSSVTAVWIPSDDTLAVVFHMFVELDTRARQEYAANTLHIILDQHSIASGIGVGLSQPTLFTLSHSYTTARRALSEASTAYCLFEDLHARKNDQFSSCLQNLTTGINEGNQESAQMELAHYLRLLNKLSTKRALVQFHTARLLNELSRPFIDIGLWSPDQLDTEIERLMFMSSEDLSTTLNAAMEQIFANASPNSADEASSSKDVLLTSVHDFLMENALDPMLNINFEAEKYGMSTVALNRRFRQRYGMSMVSFISEIRMKKAQELLRTSDMRIKDIVTAVGYFDVPNFSRKFKATVGLTPGQYRQQERGDDADADCE